MWRGGINMYQICLCPLNSTAIMDNCPIHGKQPIGKNDREDKIRKLAAAWLKHHRYPADIYLIAKELLNEAKS